MMTEDSVCSMGLTLLRNRLVEGFYFLGKGELTEKLKKAAEEAIEEFDSLNYPYNEMPMPCSRLFDSNLTLDTFNNYLISFGKRFDRQTIGKLVRDLRYVVSDVPLNGKLETAGRLQRFFDGFGRYSFYATRDCLRRGPDDCRALVA